LFVTTFGTPTNSSIDKIVDLTVKDFVWVAFFVMCPQIFNHLIRIQDVGAHLVAPRGFYIPGQFFLLCLLFFFPNEEQSRLQHAQGCRTVLYLGLFILHGYHNAGRYMRHAHGRVRGVDVLSTWTRGPEHVNLQFSLGNINGIVRFNKWNNFYCSKRCMAATLIIKWRNPYKTVRARFNRQG